MIFSVSFIALFFLLQVLSGIVLTATFTPNIEEAWKIAGSSSSQEIIKGSSLSTNVFLALISGIAAFLIAGKLKGQER